MVSHSTQNRLNQEATVNDATFHVCGFKRATVRMTVGNFDMGFATLAYSGKMTDGIKEYSAERICLALHYVKGWTNARIHAELEQRMQQHQVLNYPSNFKLGSSSNSELMYDVGKIKHCLKEYEEELLRFKTRVIILIE